MSWLPRKKVVVPVDFSESSADAVREALQLVGSPTDLHVLHVLMPLELFYPGVLGEAVNEDEIGRAHV